MPVRTKILQAILLGIKRNIHVFIGLAAGILLGGILHETKIDTTGAENPSIVLVIDILDFVGRLFIRLIQMLMIPLVCSAIITSISVITDGKQFMRIGKKMILYYAVITVTAAVIGTGLALLIRPGEGIQPLIAPESTITAQNDFATASNAHSDNLTQMILSWIPQNPAESIVNGNMVPILVFVIIFAVALTKIGNISRPVVSFFETIFEITIKVIERLLKITAVPGIFSLTAVAVSGMGPETFTGMSKFIIVILTGLFIQFWLVYPLLMKFFSGISAVKLYAGTAEAMAVAFGCSNGSATLPVIMNCCKKSGISHKVSGCVLPIGSIIVKDGAVIFQTTAIIFIAQAYGIVLEPIQILILQIAVLEITALSTCADIKGSGLLAVSLVLGNSELTYAQLSAGFTLLFAVDRLIDMFTTTLNITGNMVVTAIIADNEGEIDYRKFSENSGSANVI